MRWSVRERVLPIMRAVERGLRGCVSSTRMELRGCVSSTLTGLRGCVSFDLCDISGRTLLIIKR